MQNEVVAKDNVQQVLDILNISEYQLQPKDLRHREFSQVLHKMMKQLLVKKLLQKQDPIKKETVKYILQSLYFVEDEIPDLEALLLQGSSSVGLSDFVAKVLERLGSEESQNTIQFRQKAFIPKIRGKIKCLVLEREEEHIAGHLEVARGDVLQVSHNQDGAVWALNTRTQASGWINFSILKLME